MNAILNYTPGIFNNKEICYTDSVGESVDLFQKLRKEYIWNVLRNFEGIPITLSETQKILDGFSIDGLKLKDILKVKSYGDGFDSLCEWIKDGSFFPDRYLLCELHGICTNHELDIVDRGHFRKANVRLNKITWSPPCFNEWLCQNKVCI